MSVKRYKVGTVQMKKDQSGVTVRLGSPKTKTAKDDSFVTNIEITVKDAKGKVLTKAENGFLVVQDPRKRTNKDGSALTEEQLARIPDWVKTELFLVVAE